MTLQDLEDWEFPLTWLSKVSIQLSQPLIFRQRLRNEEEPSECHVQPRLNSDLQQAPLISLRNLQPGAKALVIVLETEALLIDGHQVVFKRCFENTNDVQMVTRHSNGIGHYLYLQGPLIHLDSERRAIYITILL